MTNNLVGVSCSSNNDLHNNEHNNNSKSSGNTTNNNNSTKQSTLHLNTTIRNLLMTENTSDTDIDAKATTDTADTANTDAANEHEGLGALESASGNDNSADNCETFINESHKNNQNEMDREKDLKHESASKANPNTANANPKRQQCQQQTITTKTITTKTTTTLSGTKIEKYDTENESKISKNISVPNNGTFNSTGNQSSGGSIVNGNTSLISLHDTETMNSIDTKSKQLILNITEPHAIIITDDKLNSIRAHQKHRHSQRRLRTKALLDSLPQSLKMLGRAKQMSDYEALLAGSDELLQRLSINNPFYCFRKQSNSLKEMRALACSAERRLRKVHSETDIFSWQLMRDVDRQSNGAAMAPERYARIVLQCTGDALLGMRDTRASVWNCYAPRKRGETAVQLTDADGSVVVVLDNKQTSVVSKPKSLNSLEELLSDSSAEGAEYNAHAYLLDAVAAERAFAVSTHETDSSTVITNPFSIFLDNNMQAEHSNANARLRAASSASQQQRPLTKHQRSERSIRRLFDGNSGTTSTKCALDANIKQQTSESARQHYLNGIPVSRFERQDFLNSKTAMTLSTSAKSHKLKPKHVFKNLSLRKIHKSASGLPATTHTIVTSAADTVNDLNALPQMKKLKITYPNRTQSIHSALDVSASTRLNITLVSPGSAVSSGKHSYFERLQAKTRQGLQKLRDKCRNFKQASAGHQHYAGNGSGFSTLAKDDSFRFIGDRARISSYESKCAALNANASGRQQATIYKSYKSEIDLSKNLHYLDAYLEENFEQNLRTTKQSPHSVGRIAAGRLQRQRQLENNEMKESENGGSPRCAKTLRGRTHKRSLSAAHKSLTNAEQRVMLTATKSSNYENLGTLPIANRGCSDSLSSSDYASVFSGPTLAVEQATPVSSIDVTEPITPSLADDTSSSAGLRYEHPKMSQYFYNKLAVEGSVDLLTTTEEHRGSEAAVCVFNTPNEGDMTGVRSDFVGLGAGDDAALLVDYRRAANLDDSIRILVNETEDKDFQLQKQRESYAAAIKQQRHTDTSNDWYRPQQEQLSATDERNSYIAYNENLAESHFYRSLNQHLQQQQQQKDLYLNVEDNGALDVNSAATNERCDDKDLHYESYLEHFYRAKSGQHARKANSIGYDDERVVGIGINGIEDEEAGADGAYVARSAFRRAARGSKAGGSAFELRHSALLLLGEQKSNKTAQDVATNANARQLYNFNLDIKTAALAQEESAYGVGADKVKLPMTNKFVAAPKALGGNLMSKSRQQQDKTLALGGINVMSLTAVEHENERQLNVASSLLQTPKSVKNSLYATDAYDSYLATTPNGMKDISTRHFYNEDAARNTTATASITIPTPAGNKTPTKFQQLIGSSIKANLYLQAQQQAPSTAASALFIDGKKQGGNPGQSMVASCGDANNRYMLDNMRRHYQPQQQHHHQQKPTNSVSSSLSLSTSSSSNSSVSQPMVYSQQQQQLLLPTTITHAKSIKQQQHQPALANSAYHKRRNSTASNASSSDNFDTFIALRNAQTINGVELPSPTSTNSNALQTDYLLSTKRANIGNNSSNTSAYQQRQQMLAGAHTRTHTAVHYPTSPSSGGSSSTVPLISALNYYGTSGGSSSHSDATHAVYASSTASASASASSSSSSSSTHHKYALTANASAIASNNYALLAQMHYANKGGAADSATGNACTTGTPISPIYASERKPFILEYEC